MNIFTIIITAALLASGSASALSCNDKPNRYRVRDIFATTKETPNLQFGSNKNPLNNNQAVNLFMDLFEPAGDTCALRPAIIFMWGGGFQTGTRKDETGSCRQFAKRGFVCATSDYRMRPPGAEGAEAFGTSAFMSTQDTRGAIRFLHKNAALYRIDTNLIYIGGCSSGAYAANWTGYLDQISEVPAVVNRAALDGGIEGNSGNSGFGFKPAGVLALSGAVADTNWIVKGDVPFAQAQCSGDQTVKPEGAIGGSGMQYYGGTAMAARALHVGVQHFVLTYKGGCHCPRPIGPDGLDSTIDFFAKSTYTMMTSVPTNIRSVLALTQRELPEAGPWVDTRGRPARMLSEGSHGFHPGLYFRRKEQPR
jgi:hypothetical protein